jgi:hypothetical protein
MDKLNIMQINLKAYPKIIFLHMIMQQENCTSTR